MNTLYFVTRLLDTLYKYPKTCRILPGLYFPKSKYRYLITQGSAAVSDETYASVKVISWQTEPSPEWPEQPKTVPSSFANRPGHEDWMPETSVLWPHSPPGVFVIILKDAPTSGQPVCVASSSVMKEATSVPWEVVTICGAPAG